MTMDPELKAKWIAALRSGDYMQARGTLKGGGGFCCLGVLCEVADPNAWINDASWRGGHQDGFLPEGDGIVLPVKQQRALVTMNDELEWPFPAIASWVEGNVA